MSGVIVRCRVIGAGCVVRFKAPTEKEKRMAEQIPEPSDFEVAKQAENAALAFEGGMTDACPVCGNIPELKLGVGGRTTVHHCEHVSY